MTIEIGVADMTEPGDCPLRPSEFKSDPMAQVFTSPTTKYEAFSSATTLTASSTTIEAPSSSSVTTTTSESPSTPSSYVHYLMFRYQLKGRSSSSTISSSPSSSTSPTSITTSPAPPSTQIVQVVTLTRMKSSSQSMGGDAPSTVSSSDDLVRSTALSSGEICPLPISLRMNDRLTIRTSSERRFKDGDCGWSDSRPWYSHSPNIPSVLPASSPSRTSKPPLLSLSTLPSLVNSRLISTRADK